MRTLILIGVLLGLAQPADHTAFLPNPKITPGDVLKVDLATLCTPGYTKTVRNVPVKIKRAVFAEYGIVNPKPGQYEVDHLISLELGGSNSIRNLWPEPYGTTPFNAHVKDGLEDELHHEVCMGTLPLAQAQKEIAGDWVKSWQVHFHRQQP
jgi:hypothetical protein